MMSQHRLLLSRMDIDVAIIGGGVSGLTAAYHLHKKDKSLKICILEAKDRVGGRTLTLPLKAKNGTDHWDLGGQWVGRSQTHIMTMLDELGLDTYPQYTTGSKVLQTTADKVNIHKSNTPSYSLVTLFDIELFIRKTDKLAKEVDCRNPYNYVNSGTLDSKCMESFLKESLWTREAYQILKAAIRVTVSMEPAQISVLYFLSVVSAGGGVLNLLEANEYAAQGLNVKGGVQQISEILAERIGTDKLLLEHSVQTVSQDKDSVNVICQNGFSVNCQRVILAAPPIVTKNIDFVPRLSNQRRTMENLMSFGRYIKVIVTYKEAFWKLNGHSGEALTYGGRSYVTGCDVGPLCVVFDATSANGSPALVAFIAGNQAIQWGSRDAATRRGAVLKSLQELFGPGAGDCLDYVEKDWSRERYIEGCVAGVGPGAMRNFAGGLRNPQGRIHMAGSESATEWFGYLSGAVQAGKRAANEVLYNIRPGSLSKEDISGTAYDPSFKLPRQEEASLNRKYVTTFCLVLCITSTIYVYQWHESK